MSRPKGIDEKGLSKTDGEIKAQIDKLIAAEYTPRPDWLDERCLKIRNRYLMIEYVKLQRVNGLCPERARLVLARLIDRSVHTIENIIWPAPKKVAEIRMEKI